MRLHQTSGLSVNRLVKAQVARATSNLSARLTQTVEILRLPALQVSGQAGILFDNPSTRGCLDSAHLFGDSALLTTSRQLDPHRCSHTTFVFIYIKNLLIENTFWSNPRDANAPSGTQAALAAKTSENLLAVWTGQEDLSGWRR